MIRYYCKACDEAGKVGYYSGGAEDDCCPICGRKAKVVNVIAKVGKYSK